MSKKRKKGQQPRRGTGSSALPGSGAGNRHMIEDILRSSSGPGIAGMSTHGIGPRPGQRAPSWIAAAAQPTGAIDPRRFKTTGITGPGTARSHGDVVLDTTDALILDYTEVALMSGVHQNAFAGQFVFMTLDGRIARTTDRARVAVVLNTDAAAAVVTELLALAERAGAEFLTDLTRRLVTLQKDGNADLAFIAAAIENARAEAAEDVHGRPMPDWTP